MSTTHLPELTQARRDYTPMADIAEIRRNYEYDMDKFMRYSSTKDIDLDPAALTATLASVAHALEKGLAIEEPRAGFGLGKLPLTFACLHEVPSSPRTRVTVQA